MAITPRTPAVTESSSTQTLTGALPSDLQTGDLVLALYVGAGTPTTITEPSAPWTRVIAPAALPGVTPIIAALYYTWNTAALAAPAPVMTTTTGTNRATWIVESFGGVDTGSPFDVSPPTSWGSATSTGATATTVAGPDITTVTANALLLSFLAGTWISQTTAPGSTYAVPGTMTQLGAWSNPVTNQPTAGRAAVIAQETLATPGLVTRTWTYTPTGANVGTDSMTLALRPAVAPVVSIATAGTFDPDLNPLSWW